MKGTVKNFNAERNFGFIETPEGDLFFHISDVEGQNIAQGDSVEFEKTEGDKGPKAVKVKKVSGDAPAAEEKEEEAEEKEEEAEEKEEEAEAEPEAESKDEEKAEE